MFKKILVGTDGSATAVRAVDAAADLARGTGASLVVLSAFEPVPAVKLRQERRDAPDDVQWTINPHEGVDEVLDEARRALVADIDVEFVSREGDPADALLVLAEEKDIDLIVVGNKGMTGAARFLLGSVPNKISHHAPCSVLIVRTT